MVDEEKPKRGKAIKQFMWGYQSYFRIGVETRLERALQSIGFVDDSEVFLVGFQTRGAHSYPICIEPEDGPYNPNDLNSIAARAKQLYEEHPDQEMIIVDSDGGRRGYDSFHRGLRARMWVRAIEEAFASTVAGSGRVFFVGLPAQVEDYRVHVVISLHRIAYDNVPRLRTTERGVIPITQSIIDAVIYDVLRRTVPALYVPDAGSDLQSLGADAPEIVQRAAASFIASVFYCAGFVSGPESSLTLSALSALPYEGRAGSGKLIIARMEHPAVDILVKFRELISLDDTRAVRKLIEATGPDGDLLSTDDQIYGIGRVTERYDPSSESVFIVELRDRGTWELSHADHTLLSIRDGVPSLPKSSLNTTYFVDILDRLLPGADQARLIALAQAATGSEHGAMLIISGDAAGEARRLAPQAWTVEPVQLLPSLLRQITSMDGGILVDLQGNCHAVGVIVDGLACGRENPARGSRYNNAVRYLERGVPPTVIVVYSMDGGIDVLPHLLPRVKRSTVQEAVDRYLALAEPGEYKTGRSEALDHIERLKFYLSEEQCSQVNDAIKAQADWEKNNDRLQVIRSPFTPNADMNESYWLPEDA